ncbi:sensor histidine kinase [Aerococcaceae bacterium NML190073]|nr:sensor histidine kinase [Aerococcaceae bacterium NML190073]
MKLHRKSMIWQFVCYFFVGIMVVLLIVGTTHYYQSAAIIRQMTEQQTHDSIEKTGNFIAAYIRKLKTTANALANDPIVLHYIEHPNSSENREEASTLMDTILKTDSHLVNAVLVTKDGRILSNNANLEMSTSSNMMEEPWYQIAIMQNAMPVLTSAHRQATGEDMEDWVVSVTQEIVNDAGDNLGVIRLDISYEAIETYLNQLSLGKGGYAFIVNNQQQFVYHPDRQVYTSNASEILGLLAVNGYTSDKRYFVQQTYIEDSRWTVVAVASLDELAVIRQQLFYSFFAVGVVALTICGIGLLLLSRKWLAPIKTLQQTMQRVKQGESEVRAPSVDTYELNELSHHFNHMLDEIANLMASIKETEQKARRYELMALSSQINPHFLYNTLDTIVWMAEFNEQERVVELTKSLAHYFRLALNQGEALITLDKELEHVRQYLFIQQQRYGNQLNYTLENTARVTNTFKVPKLVLQPIVENALYHGIKEIARPGWIHLSVEETDCHIIVTIHDNGKGFDAPQPTSQKRLGGVGLVNVDERLALYFGANYRMEIQSKLGEFTQVRLYLPLNHS